ncbi:MAG: hypothetical protein JWM11_3960 [Planctomycetaceae bacterium]|nr:hypothetical protein [Planctomycetaceae bacterium]
MLRNWTDGSRNTLLVIVSGPEKAIEWTRPGGLAFDRVNPSSQVGTLPGGRLWALFGDGIVRNINASRLPFDLFEMFIDPRDGKQMEQRLNFLVAEDDYFQNRDQYVNQLGQIALSITDFESFHKRGGSISNQGASEKGAPGIPTFPTLYQRRVPALHVFVGASAPFTQEADGTPGPVTAPAKTLMLILAPELQGRTKRVSPNWILGKGIPIRTLDNPPFVIAKRKYGEPPPEIEFGFPIHNGYPIVMFDGAVRLLPESTDYQTLLKLIDPLDAKAKLDIDRIAPLWK